MAKQFQQKDLPATFYKYRDWDNADHRRLITHRELYLPSPSSFNDPFDGNIPVRWDMMSYEDCFAKNLSVVKIFHGAESEEFQMAYAKQLTDSKEFFHPETMKIESAEQLEKWAKGIGLVSFSAIRDDVLMWSHYANKHSGFVVGLNTDSLLKNHDFDFIDSVEYSDKYPVIKGTEEAGEQFRKKFFIKSEKWSYEKEWRLSKNHIKNRKYKLEKESFKEIIIGCMASEETKYQIIKTVKEVFTNSGIKIFLARRNPKKYSLDLIEISPESYRL